MLKKVIVRAQNPMVLDDLSKPQPDIAIFRRRYDFYRTTGPTAKDTLLVMEISETTLRYDRDIKFFGYAANGIKEAWLIDLENDRVEIHPELTDDGYGLVKILHRGQIAESSVLHEIKIAVEEILD